jgi:hypothetical protein
MPIFIPPVLGWTLGILGSAMVARVLAKEWRRVNDELDAGASLRTAPVRENIPMLRRDPKSGIYRPE